MSEDLVDLRAPRRVPAWVLLALVPAVLIGLNNLLKGGRQRIELVGAGPVRHLAEAGPPDDLRFYAQTAPTEAPEATVARIEHALTLQPAVVVFSFDLSGWSTDAPGDLRDVYADVMRRAENAATVPVSLGPWVSPSAATEQREAVAELSAWWRRGPCARGARLLCIELVGLSEDELAPAMQAGVQSAARRLSGLRAATQRGR